MLHLEDPLARCSHRCERHRMRRTDLQADAARPGEVVNHARVVLVQVSEQLVHALRGCIIEQLKVHLPQAHPTLTTFPFCFIWHVCTFLPAASMFVNEMHSSHALN